MTQSTHPSGKKVYDETDSGAHLAKQKIQKFKKINKSVPALCAGLKYRAHPLPPLRAIRGACCCFVVHT